MTIEDKLLLLDLERVIATLRDLHVFLFVDADPWDSKSTTMRTREVGEMEGSARVSLREARELRVKLEARLL